MFRLSVLLLISALRHLRCSFEGQRIRAKWRTCRPIGIAPMVAALLVGPSSEASAKAFRFANSAEVLTMDPHGALVVFTQMIQGYVYEGLVRINKDNQFEPSLAESYGRVAPEVWRFKLRAGVGSKTALR